jgi:hypothetical protein
MFLDRWKNIFYDVKGEIRSTNKAFTIMWIITDELLEMFHIPLMSC